EASPANGLENSVFCFISLSSSPPLFLPSTHLPPLPVICHLAAWSLTFSLRQILMYLTLSAWRLSQSSPLSLFSLPRTLANLKDFSYTFLFPGYCVCQPNGRQLQSHTQSQWQFTS